MGVAAGVQQVGQQMYTHPQAEALRRYVHPVHHHSAKGCVMSHGGGSVRIRRHRFVWRTHDARAIPRAHRYQTMHKTLCPHSAPSVMSKATPSNVATPPWHHATHRYTKPAPLHTAIPKNAITGTGWLTIADMRVNAGVQEGGQQMYTHPQAEVLRRYVRSVHHHSAKGCVMSHGGSSVRIRRQRVIWQKHATRHNQSTLTSDNV